MFLISCSCRDKQGVDLLLQVEMTDLGYLLHWAFRVKNSDMSVAPACHHELSPILDQCGQGSDRASISNEFFYDAIVSPAIQASDMALLGNNIDGVIVDL
jgi:hypothetical protein